MTIWLDLKYAWRLLIKSWGYSLICATVVALSVGLAVWTYSVSYSQVLKPLPFAGSDRWYSVQLTADAASRSRANVDAYTYQQVVEQSRSAESLGGFTTRSVVLSEGEATTSLRASEISPRLLAAMRTAPLLGRTFTEADGDPGATAVAVLGFDTWQQYFAGDRDIIGKTARIDAAPVQIVGVMPRDFFSFQDYELWQPLRIPKLARPQDSTTILSPFLILREDQDPATVLNELKSGLAAVNSAYPRLFNSTRKIALVPAARIYTHSSMPIVAMLSLMSLGVLLLGCVNISMVFLARLLERTRELALRTALGASRPRLLRQCLLETGLIVLLGLVAGYGLAAIGVEWTHTLDSYGSRILADGRNGNIPMLRPADFLIAVTFAIAVWLLSTLIPAWRTSKQDAAIALASSGKGTAARGSNRSVALLVGLQVLISCLVLVACGNVVLAIRQEVRAPSGLDSAGVIISTYPTVFDARYKEAPERLRYWDDVSAAIANKIPGTAVAFATSAPTRPARVAATIETRQGGDDQGTLTLPYAVVSENYFGLMGIRLRDGRLFDRTDSDTSMKVAIVDEKMAARFWPNQNALGKRIRLNATDNGAWLTVVGVVSAVRGAPYRTDSDLGTLYQPLRQTVPPSFHALIKPPNPAIDNRTALRSAAYSVDRDLPLHNLQLFDDYVSAINLSYPTMTKVFTVIALITAILAASGLFGLISRSVAQRTQEVGIRRALGATAWRAASMFLRQGALYLSVAIVGLGVGVLLMPFLSRAFPNILDRVIPATSAVTLLMAAVIFAASYLPTRRAVALEPGDALRHD